MEQQQTNKVDVKLISHNVTNGVSKAGKAWVKHTLVTETIEHDPNRTPKKILFQQFGDMMNVVEGNIYTIEFFVSSREVNGKWYTDVSIFSITPSSNIVQPTQQVQQPQPNPQQMDVQAQAFFDSQPDNGGLLF